ncbi:O-antigen ligase family protein [Candidatus Gracilibacteria bacterium]|nr:O-antigen ligase family protein [Candidatus Gracilibacteria bacterium]
MLCLLVGNNIYVGKIVSHVHQVKAERYLLRRMLHILWLLILILIAIIIGKYFPEKLHSFLSRFYIWQTTLSIIFSDWKILLFGGGSETLSYIFEIFKAPEVYIYENFGFTADRPHNFVLNIFYHFGIIGFGVFVYLFSLFFRKLYFNNILEKTKISAPQIVIILFLLYGIIHYFSIASYLIVILAISIYVKQGAKDQNKIPCLKIEYIFASILAMISLIGAYYSIQFYRAEMLYAKLQYSQAENIFTHPKYLLALGDFSEAEKLEGILSPQNIKFQISGTSEKGNLCNILTQKYPSPENYFYCGEFLDELGDEQLSKEYYRYGLSLLPDLWNTDSLYWDNYFIKRTITGNRFFSEKFGDIGGVLEKVNN